MYTVIFVCRCRHEEMSSHFTVRRVDRGIGESSKGSIIKKIYNNNANVYHLLHAYLFPRTILHILQEFTPHRELYLVLVFYYSWGYCGFPIATQQIGDEFQSRPNIKAQILSHSAVSLVKLNFLLKWKDVSLFRPTWALSNLDLHRPNAAGVGSRGILRRYICSGDLMHRAHSIHTDRGFGETHIPRQYALSLKSHQTTKYILSRGGKIQLNRNLLQIHFAYSLSNSLSL